MGMRLSRRRFVASGLAVSVVGRAMGQAATCVLTPEQEVGPFYLDKMLVRTAIAEDRVGIPLLLRLVVMDSRTCVPLVGAAVDLWHCDALGCTPAIRRRSWDRVDLRRMGRVGRRRVGRGAGRRRR